MNKKDLDEYYKKQLSFKKKLARLKLLFEKKGALNYVKIYAVYKLNVSTSLIPINEEIDSLIKELDLNCNFPGFETIIKSYVPEDQDEGASFYGICLMVK